jgi:hypothetical protein
MRAILEKGENDAIAQLRHRPWQSQVIARRLRLAPVGVLGSIKVKNITCSGWLV